MRPDADFHTGCEDAHLAIQHLRDLGEDHLEYNDVLEYIYKNFGVNRFRDSQESYQNGISQTFEKETASQRKTVPKDYHPHIIEEQLQPKSSSAKYHEVRV